MPFRPLHHKLFYGWAYFGPVLTSALVAFRTRARLPPQWPVDGPVLILANHTSMFDPVWVGYHARRLCWFMASTALFRIPVLGKLIGWCGAFPKAKFVKDPQAMGKTFEILQKGGALVLFPEGERTWDGRPLPVLPGIGRLVHKTGVKVVCARIITGHLFHPRWAKYPRWVPVHLEYDEPVSYPADMDPEAITEDIARRIRIDPLKIEAPPGSWGVRLAHGLPDHLWACPACKTIGALQVRGGDEVACSACAAHWTVDLSSRLHGSTETTVPQAFDLITAHFGEPPVADPARFQAEGIVLDGPGGRLTRIDKQGRTLVAAGPIVLRPHELSIGEWTVNLTKIRSVSVEVANQLQIRVGEDLLQVESEGQSRLMWGYFLRHWRDQELAKTPS